MPTGVPGPGEYTKYAQFNDPPGTLPLSGGGYVRFHWLFDGYGERYAVGAAGTSTAKVVLAWDHYPLFILHAAGFTEYVAPPPPPPPVPPPPPPPGGGGVLDPSPPPPGGTLKRHVPLRNPLAPAQFTQDVSVAEYGGNKRNDETKDNALRCDWVKLALGFSTLPYMVCSDADLATYFGGDESQRYTTVSIESNARERLVSGSAYKTLDTPPVTLNVPGFVPDVDSSYIISWLQIPAGALRLDLPYLKVNDSTWTVAGLTPGFAAGTALFCGFAERLQPYRGPDGNLYVDAKYLVRYRKGGWQRLPRADGSLVEVVSVTTDLPPYQTADLKVLFKPA